MKRALVASLVLVAGLFAGAARCEDAGTAERVAEAKAIFQAMHLQERLDQMSGLMADTMIKQFGAVGAKGNTRAMRIGMEEGMHAMNEAITAPGGLIDTAAEAYASQFTFDELRQIREFYVSPLGQHVLAAQPELMRQMMAKLPELTKAAFPVACERMKLRFMAENIEGADKMSCPERQ